MKCSKFDNQLCGARNIIARASTATKSGARNPSNIASASGSNFTDQNSSVMDKKPSTPLKSIREPLRIDTQQRICRRICSSTFQNSSVIDKTPSPHIWQHIARHEKIIVCYVRQHTWHTPLAFERVCSAS